MLPLSGPLKPDGRKSPFPDPSDSKRRRISDSPRPLFSGSDVTMNPSAPVLGRVSGSPGTPLKRYLQPPTIDLACQPRGPDQDANKLLGYAPHYSDHWTANNPGALPYQLIWGDNDRHDEMNQPIPHKAETPTSSPVTTRVIDYGQQPTPPHSDPLRTPHTAYRMPFLQKVPEQPTSPQTDPRGPPPQTPFPIRPRQSKVPQRELAVQLVEFEEIAAHTAKCDVCDKRNTDGMVRCKPCGWQCCRRCLAERSGDRTHPKAVNLHVSNDTPRPTLQNPITPATGRQHPNNSQPPALPCATPEEAAWILLNLKNDKRNAGGASRTGGQIAGPSQLPNRVLDDDPGMDSDATEVMPGMGSEDETGDEEDLPDNLVNVRRNPSRRARPAELKE